MNKVSMDALNKGWALGFGTAMARRADDFDLLAAYRAEMRVPATEAPATHTGLVAGTMLRDFVASLMLRAAH